MVLKKVEVTIMCVKISKSDIIKTTMLLEMVLCFDGDSFKLFKLDTRVVSTKSIFQPSLSMCIFVIMYTMVSACFCVCCYNGFLTHGPISNKVNLYQGIGFVSYVRDDHTTPQSIKVLTIFIFFFFRF